MGPGSQADGLLRGWLAAIVDASDDAIFGQNRLGVVISWNRGATRVFGYAASEAIGRRLSDVLSAPPADVLEAILARVLTGERVEHLGIEACRKDGLVIPVDLTVSPIRDDSGAIVALSATARDVTERRLALETLTEAALRLDEDEALAHIGSWAWDVPNGVVQWSAELHRIAGISPAQFEGTLDAHLACIHEQDRERVARALDDLLAAGSVVEDEHRLVHDGGVARWAFARARVVRSPEGDVLGVRGIWQDVTERREAAEALKVAFEREHEALEELRAIDRLKDEFLAIVSHELRTPLTSVIGFGSLLVAQPELLPRVIDPLLRNAEEMHQMIERLLDFTRLESGKVKYRAEEVSLAAEIDHRLSRNERLTAGHRVLMAVPESLRVMVDPVALAHILGNLVSNAAKFAPAGSAITLSAAAEDGWAVVSVADEGPGVAPGHESQVFERFFQGPEQPPGRRGTGVGLAIVKRHVELAGGRVWYRRGGNGGAVFSFTLPLAGAPIVEGGVAP